MPQRHWRLLVAALCSVALVGAAGPALGVADPTVTNGPLLDSGYQLDFLNGTSRNTYYYVDQGSRFAPDGNSYTYVAANANVETLKRHRRDGVNLTIAAMPAGLGLDEYDWSEGGASLWAMMGGSLWRIVPGSTPTEIGHVSFVHEPGEGSALASDSHQQGIGYIGRKNLYLINTRTGAQNKLTSCVDLTGCQNRVYEYVIDRAADGRWLVQYHTATPDGSGAVDEGRPTLGWLASDGTFLSTILELPPSGAYPSLNYNVFAEMVSPDGKQILMHGNDGDVEFDHVLGSTRRLSGEHVDWQPCAHGQCPRFVSRATVPSAPKIGTASPGLAGGTLTASVTWLAPSSDGGRDLTGYVVLAARVNSSGHIVSTTTQSVGPTATSATRTLTAGRYKFKVRAKNALGSGAWSAYSKVVVPR